MLDVENARTSNQALIISDEFTCIQCWKKYDITY